MQPGISTHVFLQQRLNHGLLDALHKGGAQAIEVFAVRHHFDYADRSIVRDIATWFRSNDVAATLHQPLYADAEWSRHVAPTLNLIDPEKSRRIDAMDEVKRAIESAEQIPFRAITLHLGLKDESWNTRALENSLTAIEHLKAFAHPLGVKILLENLQNEVTTPEHLLEILRVGHFDNVGITFDVGHAHLSEGGIDAAFELLRHRIAELHLHDNQGVKDDHLWPVSIATNPGAPRPDSGTWDRGVDWKNVVRQIATLPPSTPGILEIAHDLDESPESVTKKSTNFFSNQSRLAEGMANAE